VGAAQTIDLFALGPLTDERTSALLSTTTQFVGIYFQESVRLAPERALPTSALRQAEGLPSRYDAAALLEGLAGQCPSDAAACLAVTEQDLTLEGLRYLFGLGRPRDRLGVMSTFRFGADARNGLPGASRPARPVDRLRRALKVAAHEVGHQFGLAHCRHFADCVMAGSGSLEEIDDRHLLLCPLEHAKLEWKLGFSSARRFAELGEFAVVHGLHREAAYWTRMAGAAPPYPQADGAAAP
jgi:archaemetzincin